MFVMHGWIAVHTSPSGDERADLLRVSDWLRDVIDALPDERELTTTTRNGHLVVQVLAVQNRENGVAAHVLELLRDLGQKASGSYGLVHIRNSDHSGRSSMMVMRRGMVAVEGDRYLSPAIPTIED